MSKNYSTISIENSTCEAVRKIIENLHDMGVTVILNSHLLSEVEKTCETAAIMYKGKILVKDTIDAIVKDQETLEDVFIRYIEQENA